MKSLPNEREILHHLVALQSISTDEKKRGEMRKTVGYLQKLAKALSMQTARIETPTYPLFVAYLDAKKPITRAFYSHYDVQPEGSKKEWNTPPFALTEKNGKLFGRGTADDKGHIAQVFKALEHALASNSLTSNVLLIYEGEEELGSVHFEKASQEASSVLKKADVFYILDSSVKDDATPEVLYGLRGIIEFELVITTATQELHSGLYGNVAPNAATVMSQYFSRLFTTDNFINVPGLYTSVTKLTPEEKALLKKDDSELEELKKRVQLARTVVPNGRAWYEVSKTLPSLDIHGIRSGFVDGVKNIIPNSAKAIFSLRLAPNQNPKLVQKSIETYTKKFFGPIHYSLTQKATAYPFLTSIDNVYIKEFKQVLVNYFPNPIRFSRSGGSIPAARILGLLYKKPVIVTGFTSPNSNLHAPNEYISSALFEKGVHILQSILTL